jgi:hypothetical protein
MRCSSVVVWGDRAHYRDSTASTACNWREQALTGILFAMKALRTVAIAVCAVVVLYQLVIAFIPDWMIVGVRFRWPQE